MKAKDIMTAPVLSVALDTPVGKAVELMLQNGISGLPVTDKDGLVAGMVTEGDFLRRAETGTQRRRPRWLELLIGAGRLANEYTHSHGRKVRDVMTRNVVTAAEETSLGAIVDLMESNRIKRIPIVADRRLVGIVTRASLLQALASVSREVEPSRQSDEAIRSLLLTELAKQQRAPVASEYVNPIVRNGIVEIWGTITDERERRALLIAAENAPGVKAVRDHIVSIDPVSGLIMREPRPS